jgi:hypothetical protein
MIALAQNCLLFRLANGESVPFTADMIAVELVDDTARRFDAEFVLHAANAVFHYFKQDLARESVTVPEFAEALEKVLRGFSPCAALSPDTILPRVLESDLRQLAKESGKGCELFFFPLLRRELKEHLERTPRVVRFVGLRGCVKQLVGARRWNLRCRNLEEQIVEFLRECLTAEKKPADCALVISDQ